MKLIHKYGFSNVTKLEKEQRLLHESIEATSQLNKRLQSIGLNTHAIFEKKDEEIKYLREQLSNTIDNLRASQLNLDDYSYTPKKSKIDAQVFFMLHLI